MTMRLPNGYGGVVKLSGNRRRPYAARITTGWHVNDLTGKRIQHYQSLGIDCTPHCCRHTCISMLADAHVDQTIIKKIVGHSGAMTLTERVYTHLDVQELVQAINLI